MRHWLLKSEPTAFSFGDLERAPRRTTCWDGVRNYQARNLLRDDMKKGDLCLFYHSSAEPMAVFGVVEIVKDGYPDHTQFDPDNIHYDAKADPDVPTWYMVDIRLKSAFKAPVTLGLMRETTGLEEMVLLQRGSRLSVQPVTAAEFSIVCRLGGA